MERRTSVDEYLVRPFGAYYAGAAFLHFFADRELCGTVFWGRPDEATIGEFARVLVVELPDRSPLHDVFVDTRHIDGIDPNAYDALSYHLSARAPAINMNVRRQAIVRPSGVVGALVAGFYDVNPRAAPRRRRVLTDPLAALTWLDRHDATPLLVQIEGARVQACGTAPLIHAVRECVTANPHHIRIQIVADELGVSVRTLQARLRRASTTFRREVNHARVEAAKAMMLAGDRKLSAIASQLGFSSVQHFSTLFRKATGSAPSVWRAQNRSRSQ